MTVKIGTGAPLCFTLLGPGLQKTLRGDFVGVEGEIRHGETVGNCFLIYVHVLLGEGSAHCSCRRG